MKNTDIILLALGVAGIVIVLNAIDNTGSDLIDSGSDAINSAASTSGNTIAQVAPWGIGAIIAWGLFLT